MEPDHTFQSDLDPNCLSTRLQNHISRLQKQTTLVELAPTVRWVGLQCRVVVFSWSYCNFGNFRENFIFVNCIKRNICDAIIATKARLTYISKRQSILAISRGGGVFSRNFAYANDFAK